MTRQRLTLIGLVGILALAMMAPAMADSHGPEITAPTADEVVYENTLVLEGHDTAAADNNARWAVRYDTCDPVAEANRAGNVTGVDDEYDWAEGAFSATVDITDWDAGEYCFVLNTEQGDAEGSRLTQWFYIADHYVKAGGVVDAEHLDFAKIGNGTHAFEGWIADAGGAGILGEFTLNHRAGVECTYTPGEQGDLDVTTSVVNPDAGLIRAVLTDWVSTEGSDECERNDIRFLEREANEYFPRGGIYTPNELDTGRSDPPNDALDYWVPLTHGNVHVISR